MNMELINKWMAERITKYTYFTSIKSLTSPSMSHIIPKERNCRGENSDWGPGRWLQLGRLPSRKHEDLRWMASISVKSQAWWHALPISVLEGGDRGSLGLTDQPAGLPTWQALGRQESYLKTRWTASEEQHTQGWPLGSTHVPVEKNNVIQI